MAIGDGNYSNNSTSDNGQKKLFEQTYYSRVRFRNDNVNLGISYRSGLMILELSSIDPSTYKLTPITSIFLSPIKANMLSEEIKNFKAYLAEGKIKENVAFGVNGGMGEKVSYIGFHSNKDKDVLVTIGKFDANGKILESSTFKFAKDYNYSLHWKDIKAMDIDRVFDNLIELDMLHYAIADFGRSMNGASGYAAADLTRYDNARILGKLDPIYDKLGIERRYNNGGGNWGSSNNFLNNASASTSSRSTSIDDVGDLLE